LPGRPKDLVRLLLSRGAGIDLGARLAIRREQIDTASGKTNALTVLTRHLLVALAESTLPRLLVHPPKQVALDEALPSLKYQPLFLRRPFALRVGHELHELHRAVGEFRSILVLPVGSLEIAEKALTGKPNVTPCRDLPCYDI